VIRAIVLHNDPDGQAYVMPYDPAKGVVECRGRTHLVAEPGREMNREQVDAATCQRVL